MKNHHILLLVSILLAFFSCYDDKGNYDYHAIPGITEIEGIEEEYTVLSYDSLKIYPELTVEGSSNYTYLWVLYNRNTPVDTISYTKDLEERIILPTGNDYNLLFIARADETEVEYSKYTRLVITTNTSSGYYVIKTIEGNADIDFYATDGDLVMSDLLYNTYGYRLNGPARRVSYFGGYFEFIESTQLWTRSNRLFLISEKDINIFDPANAEVTRQIEDVFYQVPENLNMQAVFNANYVPYLMNDGKLRKIYTQTGNVGRFGSIVEHPDGIGNEYSLSKYTTSFASQSPIFFDELSRSFWYVTSTSNTFARFSDASVSNMNYDLLYMGTVIQDAFVGHPHALMKNRDSDEYRIFKFRINDFFMGASYSYENFYTVASTSKLLTSPVKTINPSLPQIYFADGNKIRIYKIESGDESQEVFEVPAGENIIFLQADRYGSGGSAKRVLAIGVTKGDNYKIYLYNLNTTTGAFDSLERIFEGVGEAANIKFTNLTTLNAN